jgi:hypothetical protein
MKKKRDLLYSMKCKKGEKSKRLSVTMEIRALARSIQGLGGREG